jgi:hypothetical protein
LLQATGTAAREVHRQLSTSAAPARPVIERAFEEGFEEADDEGVSVLAEPASPAGQAPTSIAGQTERIRLDALAVAAVFSAGAGMGHRRLREEEADDLPARSCPVPRLR